MDDRFSHRTLAREMRDEVEKMNTKKDAFNVRNIKKLESVLDEHLGKLSKKIKTGIIMREFILNSEYIELLKLLKLLGIAETGGHAKMLVEQGEVLLNGKTEYRKRAKLRFGDEVEVLGEKIKIQIQV